MLRYKTKWYRIADSLEALREEIPLWAIRARSVGRMNICLVHHPEGIFAVLDKCPHQGVPLHTGKCTEDGKIICVWHRYAFDLRTGRGAGMHVDTFSLKEDANGVFLGKEYFSWFGE